jgi:DNA mismatch repair protein MSH5
VIDDENIIKIIGGRHPLQELVVPTFVENDTLLVGGGDSEQSKENEAPSVMLLTGANYSGKSVYLKQVGLSSRYSREGCLSRIHGPPWKASLLKFR